ncbi:hypothetical protein C4D60_Mb04t14670 [Musa balbisiana]|uniref:Uncharacterized protein n=1 Tax=Musa balbisiana TaxID=52838 RepID=A0A4S8KC31_MUSBA|nr:hypothetical protein C4D60_Mb04t14670 [Musa balbisiana]
MPPDAHQLLWELPDRAVAQSLPRLGDGCLYRVRGLPDGRWRSPLKVWLHTAGTTAKKWKGQEKDTVILIFCIYLDRGDDERFKKETNNGCINEEEEDYL